jgi:4-diphosphocytidyl-2-C-methyl-D-erythritol kinase
MTDLTIRAPAKVNLTLHVTGRREDGYHELDSLVVFAGVADLLGLDPKRPLGLDVTGPMAAFAGEDADNLVLKAARALQQRVENLRLGHFSLVKRLPSQAGLGGGSSDAAAALRLLADLNGLKLDDPKLLDAAKVTGADVPCCLIHQALRMRGIGDELSLVKRMPPIDAVLVKPQASVATSKVFEELGMAKGMKLRQEPIEWPDSYDALTWIRAIRDGRNDLETPATHLAPVISLCLSALKGTQGCLVARMSGSGSSVFGLYRSTDHARSAAQRIGTHHPDWWVRQTLLN